jgi:hypothetical protein
MKNLAHTIPSLYSNIYGWARADDERFLSGDVSKANSPDFTLAVLDGDITADVARSDFPQAKTYNLPQTADFSMLIEAVATKKADIITIDDGAVEPYLKANPGKLRKVSPQPLKVFGEHFAVKLGEHDFVNMLNTAMTVLNNSPAVEDMLKKYPSSMVPPTRTYDATWLDRRPTPLPAMQQVQTQDVPSPKAAAETAAAETVEATTPLPLAKPDDASLDKPSTAAPEKPATKAPETTAEETAEKIGEKLAEKPTEKPTEKTAEPEKATEPTAEPTKPIELKETLATEPPKKAAPKPPAKKAAPPTPTLGDVKDALEKARAAAAMPTTGPAMGDNALPPGVIAPPQPLTGAGAARNVISPSLPETTASPTAAQ